MFVRMLAARDLSLWPGSNNTHKQATAPVGFEQIAELALGCSSKPANTAAWSPGM